VAGAGAGGASGGAGAGGAEEERASDPRANALRVLEKVIMGSFGFQQFFLIYAKLMVGLRDSKVRESGPSREELD